MSDTPGLRLPAEWEPQAGVMLAWPHPQTDWADQLDRVEPVFERIALEIAHREPVIILCPDIQKADAVRRDLLEAGSRPEHVMTPVIPVNDTWTRDFGPIGITTADGTRLCKFIFNGWGEKYPAALDNAAVDAVAAQGWFGPSPLQHVDLVLEGGSIDSDGAGTLLTTSACLLHPKRNPGHTRQTLQRQLAASLGTTRLLWLDNGCLEGDDTDSHVDMLVRFTDNDTLVYQGCDEAGYSCQSSLAAMEKELTELRTMNGTTYNLNRLPWPRALYDSNQRRLPASYANFLVVNGAVLVPQYSDPADDIALNCLKDCFPQHEIIGIDCLPLIQQNGSLHCLTMQLPVGTCLEQADRPLQ